MFSIKMNIGITVNRDRVAPVFLGVHLQIMDEEETSLSSARHIDTNSWPILAWAPELMQHDVGCLLCAAIDRFTLGALQGYGIEVISNITGSPDEVITQWRHNTLTTPEIWPSQLDAEDNTCIIRQKDRDKNR